MDESEKRMAKESGWPDELYEGLLRAACRAMHIDFERRYAPERREHREKHNDQ